MIAAMVLASVAGATCPVPTGAGIDASTQHEAYAKRSIEIVARAAAKDEVGLAKLLSPDAEFSLGAGDVGRPFGNGIKGAYALADELKASTYEYNGWDYMPMPRDPCEPHDVEIEFISSGGTSSANVKFHYEGGLLHSATGWSRSRIAGRVVAEAR